jgi:hypothetical protein
MTQKNRLLILAIPIAFLVVLALAITIPHSPNRHRTSPQNACINNLRQIDGAKQQWALEHNKTNGTVTWNDILPYMGRRPNVEVPRCPANGTYTLGNIEVPPKCSIAGHTLQ